MPIAIKGRHYALAWVAVLLLAAAIVSLRDRRGFKVTKRIEALERTHQVVSHQLLDVHAEVTIRTSPGELRRVGERLGLRIPTDSEIEQVGVPRY